MIDSLINGVSCISVTGLGYVGLPVALAFAKKFKVIAFDLSHEKIEQLKRGVDPSGEVSFKEFEGVEIEYTSDPDRLNEAHFHVIAVPTPVDVNNKPNLSALKSASLYVAKALKPGDFVVYESTVYPGCTESDCLPILENSSGLKLNRDFYLGYSPERINPGDKKRTLKKITKVVSGSNEYACNSIAEIYATIIDAGVFKASCIKVAEAAKVIENTQRDLNIALMNELSILFDKMDIDTYDVLEAAGTKWNFLKFYPGLVGGHCIGVDPYYLTFKAEQLGYSPKIILSGRKINDGMSTWVTEKTIQLLSANKKPINQCKVALFGITFKEDVNDIRNSKTARLAQELIEKQVQVDIWDPHASERELINEYGLVMKKTLAKRYDAVIIAVAHKQIVSKPVSFFKDLMPFHPILIDLKGIFRKENLDGCTYWSF